MFSVITYHSTNHSIKNGLLNFIFGLFQPDSNASLAMPVWQKSFAELKARCKQLTNIFSNLERLLQCLRCIFCILARVATPCVRYSLKGWWGEIDFGQCEVDGKIEGGAVRW